MPVTAGADLSLTAPVIDPPRLATFLTPHNIALLWNPHTVHPHTHHSHGHHGILAALPLCCGSARPPALHSEHGPHGVIGSGGGWRQRQQRRWPSQQGRRAVSQRAHRRRLGASAAAGLPRACTGGACIRRRGRDASEVGGWPTCLFPSRRRASSLPADVSLPFPPAVVFPCLVFSAHCRH